MNIIKYFLDMTLGKAVNWCMLWVLNGTGLKREFSNISIVGTQEVGFQEFSACACEALSLLKALEESEYIVVNRNLKYIIHITGNDAYLAKFWHACCIIPWDNWRIYSNSIRSKLMAAAIVHEAYHGEYIRLFGLKAFNSSHYETECRKQEIKMLIHFRQISNGLHKGVYDRRIRTLEQ